MKSGIKESHFICLPPFPHTLHACTVSIIKVCQETSSTLTLISDSARDIFRECRRFMYISHLILLVGYLTLFKRTKCAARKTAKFRVELAACNLG